MTLPVSEHHKSVRDLQEQPVSPRATEECTDPMAGLLAHKHSTCFLAAGRQRLQSNHPTADSQGLPAQTQEFCTTFLCTYIFGDPRAESPQTRSGEQPGAPAFLLRVLTPYRKTNRCSRPVLPVKYSHFK